MARETVRKIAHIDMDAFFASCELSQYPELRGRPMVVGGRSRVLTPDEHGKRNFPLLRDYVGRGVLTTATYEARAFGVHSGMPTMKAARLAPDAVILPVNFELYRRYSRLFKEAVRSISPLVQDIGIDEVYADVSEFPGETRAVAEQLRAAVLDACGLTCSVGVAPNKLLAKLCSDLKKPNGITVVTMDDIPTTIWPLPAQRVNGIGPKAAAKLEALGIMSIGDIAAREKLWLIQNFGQSYGQWLYEASHGLDDRPVVTHREPVSMSRETTFEQNLHAIRDREELGRIFTRLCQQVAEDLARKNYASRTIGIKLRFDDFTTVTRDLTLPTAISDAVQIRQAGGSCLKRVEFRRSLRLLGVRAGSLERPKPVEPNVPLQAPLDFS